MLLYLDKNRKILEVNYVISHASALKVIAENPLAEWHETEFSFLMGEDRPGFEKAFYLETDGTIRIEYAEIPLRLPTPEEVIQAKLDYLMMMAG